MMQQLKEQHEREVKEAKEKLDKEHEERARREAEESNPWYHLKMFFKKLFKI